MSSEDDSYTTWMSYELPLSEELKLEHAIREVSAHHDTQKVRDLCASLMRQNFHQQQLLSKAIGHINQLELVLLLGATAEPHESDVFLAMARQVCDDLGIS